MKRMMRSLYAAMLILEILITEFRVSTKTASAQERLVQNYVYDGFTVEVSVKDMWDDAFNAEVYIVNTGVDEICDWSLGLEYTKNIRDFWNANLVEHTGNTYWVENAGWNANIKPGESVIFGMTVLKDENTLFPEKFSLRKEKKSVTLLDFAAEFMLYSDWETGCNGAIILRNLSDVHIANWQLEFDCDREITDISNAEIVSNENGHYLIRHNDYNADIEAGASVYIGIVAGEGLKNEYPCNFVLKQTVSSDTSSAFDETPNDTQGNIPSDIENEGEEMTEEEKEAVIAERLKGVKYKAPEPGHMQYEKSTDTYYVDNQVGLIVKNGVTIEQVESLAEEIGASVVGYIIVTGDYQLEFATAKSWEELNGLADSLFTYDWVEEIVLQELYEIDICASLDTPDDPAWYMTDSSQNAWMNEWDENFPAGNNWSLEAINARGAWEAIGDKGQTVNVGIIDTMFDTEHEDLKDVFAEVWQNRKSEDIISYFQMYYPSCNANAVELLEKSAHGTHTAGTFAAAVDNGKGVSGVANNVKLYGVAINGMLAGGEKIQREATLQYKYAIAKLVLSECKVINISMNCRRSSIAEVTKMSYEFESFVKKLLDLNFDFLIVQAAGNDDVDAYYAGMFAGITDETVRKHVIIVGAIGLNEPVNAVVFGKDAHQSNGYLFTGFHYCRNFNFGEKIDICAPGEKIYSTLPGNRYSDVFIIEGKGIKNEKVSYWSGTSMAAPHVAGTAALCFSANSKLTAAQVKEIICNSYSQYIYESIHGYHYKLLNAETAVNLALATKGDKVEIVERPYGVLEGRIILSSVGSVSVPYGAKNGFVYAYAVDLQGNQIPDKKPIISSLGEKGEYELFLPEGEYHIIAYYPDYKPTEIQTRVKKNEVYLEDITIYKNMNSEEKKEISGVISDEITGEALAGVKVEVINGMRYDLIHENEFEVLQTGTTDKNGKYSFFLLPGLYMIRLSKDGYFTSYSEIVCADNVDDQNAVISKALDEEEYRIVLEWGETPNDLDAHLEATRLGKEIFHVCYWNMQHKEDGQLVAELDWDDTDGYGPETITLTATVDREIGYRYYVYDYTNGYMGENSYLSQSEARVKVYNGNELLKTYIIPKDQTGTVWDVFEIIHGEVIDRNQVW